MKTVFIFNCRIYAFTSIILFSFIAIIIGNCSQTVKGPKQEAIKAAITEYCMKYPPGAMKAMKGPGRAHNVKIEHIEIEETLPRDGKYHVVRAEVDGDCILKVAFRPDEEYEFNETHIYKLWKDDSGNLKCTRPGMQ